MSERAFPINDPRSTEQRGMELRDYFAAKVLQAMISNFGASDDLKETVRCCYQIADAMMEQRYRDSIGAK